MPLNKASSLLVEIKQQEKTLQNRINYLQAREDKILKDLEEKQRMVEIHENNTLDRRRRMTNQDEYQSIVNELSRQQRIQHAASVLDKKMCLYEYRMKSAIR